MGGTGAGRGWGWALLGSAAALGLLWAPVPVAAAGRMWGALADSGHVGLFAALAWLWGRVLPGRWRGGRLWLVLALCAAAVEGGQARLGRSADWRDGGLGILGAAVVCMAPGKRGLRIGGLGLLALAPVLWDGLWIWMEARAYPVLFAPDAGWASAGWTRNGVVLRGADGGGLRVAPDPAAAAETWPGLFREPGRRDWSGGRGLRAKVFWPAAVPAVMAVRVDDRPGNPPYAERFQKEFAVTQGWNSVWISRGELQTAGGGRPLDLSAVRQWGVFLVSEEAFDYFLLGSVRLELREEPP